MNRTEIERELYEDIQRYIANGGVLTPVEESTRPLSDEEFEEAVRQIDMALAGMDRILDSHGW